MHANQIVHGFQKTQSRTAASFARCAFLLALALATGGVVKAAPISPATLAPTARLAAVMQAGAVSLTHFDHLYADLEIDGKPMAVVHIYSNFPDYSYAIEPNEGYACVDDVARAIVMLAHEWRKHRQPESLRKIRRLTEFVLHLQNSNGYFNNFIWNDLRINRDYRTSVAELNWWSLRALLSLEEAYPLLQDDAALAARIGAASERMVNNLERDLLTLPHVTTVEAGLTVPAWLPAGSGADQAAQAILALLPHYRRTGKPAVKRMVESLSDGLLLMQKGDAKNFPYGMFLSWRSSWHAWGNDQAYALLSAGEALGRRDYIASALTEVDHFYPYLLRTGFAEAIEIRGQGARYVEVSRRRFPQIAYGVRPMISAAMKAYALTKNEKYRATAAELGAWLFGRNDAGTPIYDARTGIVFDGIVGPAKLNRNSGAESTIEALLALQALTDGVR